MILHDSHQDRDADDAIRVDCVTSNIRSFLVSKMTQLFGCHIGVRNLILGGNKGYSGGKVNRALKKPPSLGEKGDQ